MHAIKTTAHLTPLPRYLPGVPTSPAERERGGIAKLEIMTHPLSRRLVMQLFIHFDDTAPTQTPYTLLLPTNWCTAVDKLAATWPRVELLTPGQFDALLAGWQSAQAQKAGA